MLPIITAVVLVSNGLIHFLQYKDFLRAGNKNSRIILVFCIAFLSFGLLMIGKNIAAVYNMSAFLSLVALFHQAQLVLPKTANPTHKNFIIVLSAVGLLILVFGILLRFMTG